MSRLGKHQKAILQELSTATLYQEQGAWYYERDGDGLIHTVIAASCRGLLERGFIYNDNTEHHQFWRGGTRWRYRLTEQGKGALT